MCPMLLDDSENSWDLGGIMEATAVFPAAECWVLQ